MATQKNENQPTESQEEPRSYPESEDLWNDIWNQLKVAPEAKKGDPWQKAVEEIKREDPEKTIEGHRFQGQGQ